VLLRADNQPIDTRFGDAAWITDFITPDNPDVILKYQQLTEGLTDPNDIAYSCWYYISHQPYIPLISAKLTAAGKTFRQKDTWFYPAESIHIGKGNCANKSFVLTSLLKNRFKSPGEVYCAVGNVTLDGIGSHAWVQMNQGGRSYLLETTQPNITKALIPTDIAEAYEPMVYFDEKNVYTTGEKVSVRQVLQSHFGVCAVPFLQTYLCERCLSLEGV
jgi:hypothetical protein